MLLSRYIPRAVVARPAQPIALNRAVLARPFTCSAIAQAKKGKKEKGGKGKSTTPAAEEADPNMPGPNEIKKEIKGLDAKFKDTVEQFVIKSQEAKQGKASTTKIGQIRVALSSDEGSQELRAVSNIQLKNNNRTIVLTVFDPKHVKYIQSGLLAELGVTPQVDNRNAQVVNVQLPTKTADAKKELAKQIKQEYEHFRNSPSKHSLTSLREDYMRHLKKCNHGKTISDDELKLFTQSVEKQFKKYSDDLASSLKKMEQSVLNE